LCHTDYAGCAVSTCNQQPVFKLFTANHVYRVCAQDWDRLARIGAINEVTGRYIPQGLR
jgi:hypothetical protein